MDQDENAGHHAVTREAVRLFFAHHQADRDAAGRIDGMTELEYFHALDRAQEHQDSVIGRTTHPATWDPDAQREHGMADPNHDGSWNLDTDRRYVENELAIAHEGGTRATEFGHLGAAAHALEDSYSEAHTFRGSAADSGDPNAPIESFNVFTPQPHLVDGHLRGKWLSDEQGTHDERFDTTPVAGHPDLDQNFDQAVPLVHGTDRAAAAATAEMLGTYHEHRDESMSAATQATRETIGHFYQSSEGGPGVNADETPQWRAERDRRLRVHADEDSQYAAPDHTGGAEGAGGAYGGDADAAGSAEANASYAPAPEPNASYAPAPEPNASYAPEPNASYQPPPEENASYQPPEENASYSSSQ